MFEIIDTHGLAQNAPFAHLGAPKGCQSVALSVHMAKIRHSMRMFGRKTARERPKRDRNRISATESSLWEGPRTVEFFSITFFFYSTRVLPRYHGRLKLLQNFVFVFKKKINRILFRIGLLDLIQQSSSIQ
jgi:hypothetical protein